MNATTEQIIADAIRKVTATVQAELAAGRRSNRFDADDFCDLMLAVADEIDTYGQPLD